MVQSRTLLHGAAAYATTDKHLYQYQKHKLEARAVFPKRLQENWLRMLEGKKA
jgi:hypothetical protein